MPGKKFIIFFSIFTLLVIISTKINFSKLVGTENQFFTLYQFFGPIAGGILGPFIGAGSVLAASVINFLASGTESSLLNLLRITPMLFAAFYFGKKGGKLSLLAPVLAIIAFNIHPVGREVWYFSLFWTIPLISAVASNRLYLRSLGSTFTAHAVGGAIWIWTVPMPAEAWIGLIPVVILERLLFAGGISLSYIGAVNLVHYLERYLPDSVKVDNTYIYGKKSDSKLLA